MDKQPYEPPNHAISLRPPWGWAITDCGKDVENRKWPDGYPALSFRGRVMIHHSKTYDEVGAGIIREMGFEPPAPEDSDLGAYIGEMEITDVKEPWQLGANLWAFGPKCLMVVNVKKYPRPIPGPGKLGIYTLAKGIRDAAREMMSDQEDGQ